MNVSVIGAGTMGNGIAHVFAQHGHAVTLVDLDPSRLDAARTTIDANLGRQVKKEKMTADDAAETLGRIALATDLAQGVAAADLVVEAATENPDVKADLFRQIDAAAPAEAILATNTSSISITTIAAVTARPEKVIGMHFFNPVPVMALVEIVRGLETSQATTDVVQELAEGLGKTPVEVSDFPGFVSNRVLMPMINEAITCVMEGVATPEAIDTVMRLGMAHPMGPLALADFIGLDVCLAIMEVLHRDLGDSKYRPAPAAAQDGGRGAARGASPGSGFYAYPPR